MTAALNVLQQGIDKENDMVSRNRVKTAIKDYKKRNWCRWEE
tara:strand:+ start:595 stop:720 length:126 start_codon:yes stop_codon:yes gene_type:complete